MRRLVALCLAFTCLLASTVSAAPNVTALDKAHAWVMDFITKVAPPGRKIYYEGGQETEEEALERYSQIAWDIVEVAYAPETKSIFSSQNHGRSQTAAVWMGIMLQESGFMKHVDYNIGPHGRGDGGLSWCMMQLRIGKGHTIKWNWKHDRKPRWGDPEEEIFEGYTGDQLIEDRQKCIKEGHKLVRVSFKACEELPLQDRLTAYAVGRCYPKDQTKEERDYIEGGKVKSRARIGVAIRYFERTKLNRGFKDQEVTQELIERSSDEKQPAKVAQNPS